MGMTAIEILILTVLYTILYLNLMAYYLKVFRAITGGELNRTCWLLAITWPVWCLAIGVWWVLKLPYTLMIKEVDFDAITRKNASSEEEDGSVQISVE
jgi:hypothetical protein